MSPSPSTNRTPAPPPEHTHLRRRYRVPWRGALYVFAGGALGALLRWVTLLPWGVLKDNPLRAQSELAETIADALPVVQPPPTIAPTDSYIQADPFTAEVATYGIDPVLHTESAMLLGINLAGAFLMAVLVAAVPTPASRLRLFFGVGVLGGFSSFTAMVALVDQPTPPHAGWFGIELAAYCAVTMLLGLIVVRTGLRLGLYLYSRRQDRRAESGEDPARGDAGHADAVSDAVSEVRS